MHLLRIPPTVQKRNGSLILLPTSRQPDPPPQLMLLSMPDPLQMIIHLRVQRFPPFAREAENRVIAAQPALHRVVQVESRFGVFSEVFHPLELSGFGFQRLVEADEVGCAQEVAEEGFAADSEEAGEGQEGLGGFDGWGVTVD